MKHARKPSWLKVSVASGSEIRTVEEVLGKYRLNSVCSEALCPNRIECYKNLTATFLILGRECTRGCKFCNISREKPLPPDPHEPGNIAEAVRELKLKYVVITSVTRDDLGDGGSGHFCRVVEEIRKVSRDIKIELLIPDFGGSRASLDKVININPDVINHNLETVSGLYDTVRTGADYSRSLEIISRIKKRSDIPVKSGIILGLGESEKEIMGLLKDLKEAGCDLLTIGQYLSPSKKHLKVDRYITPEEFTKWNDIALEMGFKGVQSGPKVRSSYHADSLINSVKE